MPDEERSAGGSAPAGERDGSKPVGAGLRGSLRAGLGDLLAEVLRPLGSDGGAAPVISRGLDCHVVTLESSALLRGLSFLRDAPELLFSQLVDLTALDDPSCGASSGGRFTLVYHLLSMHHNLRLRVKARSDGVSAVPSVTRFFPVADWLEREVWDMFGVPFSGHPDLRRILTDYGFEGHPLRKDFPLTGHVEVRYDEERKEVVYEPVRLEQAYRSFDFESPWEEVHRLFASSRAASSEADAEPPGAASGDEPAAGEEKGR